RLPAKIDARPFPCSCPVVLARQPKGSLKLLGGVPLNGFALAQLDLPVDPCLRWRGWIPASARFHFAQADPTASTHLRARGGFFRHLSFACPTADPPPALVFTSRRRIQPQAHVSVAAGESSRQRLSARAQWDLPADPRLCWRGWISLPALVFTSVAGVLRDRCPVFYYVSEPWSQRTSLCS
ncbi:hypothetical protein B0H14DRAFT_3881021, partial [Mycena olivaceomarginata]